MTIAEKNIDQIKSTWSNIHFNYNSIAAKCNAAQKKELDLHEAHAFLAVLNAADSVLSGNDAEVQRIRGELQAANTQIETTIKGFADVVAFLGLLATAVQLAATLAVIAA